MARSTHSYRASLLLLLASFNVIGFDWLFYTKKNRLKEDGINNWAWALNHFIHEGMAKGLKSTPAMINNTNFDWKYYIEKNQLKEIHNKLDSYNHYIAIGKSLNLSCCESFNIVILFHLYSLNLMDEFIQKINFFMKNNPSNTYYVKINVPIDDRIFEFADRLSNFTTTKEYAPIDYIKEHTPYHKALINDKNAVVLFNIACYLEQQLHLPEDRLQIIFSENKGMDIGGFFLLLDQIKKENLEFDFLIKLHTKRATANHPGETFGPNFGTGWRDILTSFMNIKINTILRKHECIYSSKLNSAHDCENNNPNFIKLKENLCNILHVCLDGNYNFCAGTIFIAPYRFFEHIKSWDFLALFDMLNQGSAGVSYANVYERLFGYIFRALKLKTLCLDYYGPDYPTSLESIDC